MVSIFVSLERTGKPNLNLIGGRPRKPGTFAPRSPSSVKSTAEPVEAPDQFGRDEVRRLLRIKRGLDHKNLGAAPPGLR
jgi:hypothetical protein